MGPSFNVFALIHLLGLLQAFVLATALLMGKGQNARPNRFLGALLVTVVFMFGGIILNNTGYILLFPHLARTYQLLNFIAGPLLLFYAQALAFPAFTLRRKQVLHFVPFFLYAAYTLPFYLQGASYKLNYLTENFTSVSLEWYLNAGLIISYTFLYHLLALRVVVKHLRRTEEHWRRIFQGRLAVIAIILLACFSSDLAQLFRYAFAYQWNANNVAPLLGTLFLYVLTFVSLKQSRFMFIAAAKPSRYENSTLSPEQARVYAGQLIQVMALERPFLDQNLTLQCLADRLSILNRHLSQVINEHLDQNFSDFVNGYRVETAKKGLCDPHKRYLTIEAIAQDAGFSSRSAFYNAFKKHVGMTPIQFSRTYAVESTTLPKQAETTVVPS